MSGQAYTWGISGPTFLLLYVVLMVSVALAGTRARRALADVPTSRPYGDLDRRPYDVAYLNGGRELAVTAALGAMHRAGTITTSGRRGTVVAGARPDGHVDELEWAIHGAASARVHRRELPHAAGVASALRRIDTRLVDGGLLLDDERRRRIRAVSGWTFALAALGFVRFVSGVFGGRPTGFLIVLLGVVVALAVVQWRRVPRRSRAGDAVLADLVQQHHALSPSMRPDWAVYGPAGAALSVGVFGVGALWASDPAFAAEAAVHRVGGWSGGGSSSFSSGGDSGGSGSSCGGGGGGCGGGGCGG